MNRSLCFLLHISLFTAQIQSGFSTESQSSTAPASLYKRKALYNSLDTKSIAQHLAFYQLYSDSKEGKDALADAWRLLSGNFTTPNQLDYPIVLPRLNTSLENIIAIVNKRPDDILDPLDQETLDLIENLASRLPNRQLKGHNAGSEQEVLALSPGEIDLVRGLFLAEDKLIEGSRENNRNYEAMIDLMALQILAKLPPEATPKMKIDAINSLVFTEMGFRFPPHSTYAQEIDIYTFLPAVLDSRRGVCLGVSILYLCLAQRLDLPLELITPPGHIYVRYNNGKDCLINIETTARGIHVPCEEYLGVEVRKLQQRNLKEVIGLTHFNQASVYWKHEQYQKALNSYQKAQKYLPNDPFIIELMGYNTLLLGNEEEGKRLLKQIVGVSSEYSISKDSMVEDYLNGAVDAEGIRALFLDVDEKRESILKKKTALETTLKHYPQFRAGIFALAATWLQLHRQGEAVDLLEQYHQLESHDPSAEYYLTMLYASRLDYQHAWDHFHRLEVILKEKNHQPKLLKEVRNALKAEYPE